MWIWEIGLLVTLTLSPYNLKETFGVKTSPGINFDYTCRFDFHRYNNKDKPLLLFELNLCFIASYCSPLYMSYI